EPDGGHQHRRDPVDRLADAEVRGAPDDVQSGKGSHDAGAQLRLSHDRSETATGEEAVAAPVQAYSDAPSQMERPAAAPHSRTFWRGSPLRPLRCTCTPVQPGVAATARCSSAGPDARSTACAGTR